MTTAAPYQLLDRLGAGSTGIVHRARHTGSGEVVAIKEVSSGVRADPAALARLRHEARLLAGLSHPNIVRVIDVVDEPDRFQLVLEYVDGSSLGRVLAAHGRLTPEQSLMVLRGALMGLGFAHQHGIVHGDVSLDNLLLTTDGTTKLVDFGLAAPAGSAGGIAATPAFTSPEVITGGARTPASDVYSAAAVLWTLLAGRPPFPDSDVAAVLDAHVQRPAPRLEGHGADLADLLDRALAKEPTRRPADGAALLGELERAAERRLGPGWAARASLTGLAATATGAHVTATLVGAGAATESVPAVVASAVLGAGGRGLLRSKLGWLGAAAGVATAAAVAAVVLTGGSDPSSTTPAAEERGVAAGENAGGAAAENAGGAAEDPAANEQEDGLPVGDYVLDFVVTGDSGVGWEVVGTRGSAPWNDIELDCSGNRCSGPFDDGAGSITFDGTTMEVTGTTQTVLDCVDTQTGEVVPGATASISLDFTAVATVSGTGADGRPTLTGTMDLAWTALSTTGGCEEKPPGTSTRDITLRPV